MKHDNFRLCYAEGDWSEGKLYFTEKFDDQWGDDWNDVPYEHNAGQPYEEDDRRVISIYFEGGDFIFPNHNQCNSQFSVEDINKGDIPWLRPAEWADHECRIRGGDRMAEVLTKLRYHGAKIFVPETLYND